MCVACISALMPVCLCVCSCACLCVFACLYERMYTYLHGNMYAYACIRVCLCVCMCVCPQSEWTAVAICGVRVSTDVHGCMDTCVWMHGHLYT